jgi:acetyltransferase-like isoleucine patch superfamily enzyme
MKSKLAFDQNMFIHINEGRISEGKKPLVLFELVGKLLIYPLVFIPLSFFERIVGILLALPIPFYKSLIYAWVSSSRGLPKFFGMYLRALYYRRILNDMESNVFIDQGVVFAHPKGVTLREFSYIDKRVMILCDRAIVGRRVHIASNVFISGGGTFEIENYACIATGTSVITSTEILKDGARCSGPMVTSSQRKVVRGHVHIEKDAFLGPHVVILPDIVVKQGSVVASGVTVAKSTDPWGIYVGGKAEKISKRDPVKHHDD